MFEAVNKSEALFFLSRWSACVWKWRLRPPVSDTAEFINVNEVVGRGLLLILTDGTLSHLLVSIMSPPFRLTNKFKPVNGSVMDGHNNTTSLSNKMSHVVVKVQVHLSQRGWKIANGKKKKNAFRLKRQTGGKRCKVTVKIHMTLVF